MNDSSVQSQSFIRNSLLPQSEFRDSSTTSASVSIDLLKVIQTDTTIAYTRCGNSGLIELRYPLSAYRANSTQTLGFDMATRVLKRLTFGL